MTSSLLQAVILTSPEGIVVDQYILNHTCEDRILLFGSLLHAISCNVLNEENDQVMSIRSPKNFILSHLFHNNFSVVFLYKNYTGLSEKKLRLMAQGVLLFITKRIHFNYCFFPAMTICDRALYKKIEALAKATAENND